MPKKKQFLDAKKSAAQKNHVSGPKTANEYLSAGVNFEEAGEKWRAGDAAKSSRFFLRAIENYEVGLQRFPQSFDLAYNKARLEYEVAQQPRILSQLSASIVDWLQLALNSHQVALKIDQDNADLLFNTAQVLTSLAEASTEGRTASSQTREDAVRMFQEALELFQRCLLVQELEFTRSMEQTGEPVASIAANQDEDADMAEGSTSDASGDEAWAVIVEPVTKDTLLETIIAQLETLTAICSLIGVPGATKLTWIEEYYCTTIRDKLNAYTSPDDPTRQQELALVTAKFTCAIADAGFRGGYLDLDTYERELDAAFHPDRSLTNNPQVLCDQADAELVFNASIHAQLHSSPHSLVPLNALRWTHITRALNALSAAAALPHAQNLPRIHLRRGDCELFRRSLAAPPTLYDVAIRSAATLLRNAEVYYKGAAGVARSERSEWSECKERSEGSGSAAEEQDDETEAVVKQAVVCALKGDMAPLHNLCANNGNAVRDMLRDMRDEWLLGADELGGFS